MIVIIKIMKMILKKKLSNQFFNFDIKIDWLDFISKILNYLRYIKYYIQ